jgi:hypothetical protein
MKVLLHRHEWDNRWIPYFQKELSRYDLTVTSSVIPDELLNLSRGKDLLVSMWSDEIGRAHV